MKVAPLTEKDIETTERPAAPIRDRARQERIIRSIYLYGTEAEKVKMDSIVGMPDVQPEVRDLIQVVRGRIESRRIPQGPIPSPISFSEPDFSEAF